MLSVRELRKAYTPLSSGAAFTVAFSNGFHSQKPMSRSVVPSVDLLLSSLVRLLSILSDS